MQRFESGARRATAVLLGLALAACVPSGGRGGGGDDDDARVEGDGMVDPDDGVPPGDMLVDPDDGIPPEDMFIDPDDGIPQDMSVEPGDGGVPDGCMASPESCNGVDDDCDGRADEDFADLGEGCAVVDGPCEVMGIVVCGPGGRGTVCEAPPLEPMGEICNGFDDDCDGAVDEAIDEVPCETGADGICGAGTTQCLGGEPVCIADRDPLGEVCNSVDDDCDGRSDEGTDGGVCQTGRPGRCAEGRAVCAGGVVSCDSPAPIGEVCSGQDDDCDGRVDEGGVCEACAGIRCPPGQVCQAGACIDADVGDATPIADVGGQIERAGAIDAADPVWDRFNEDCSARYAQGQHFYDVVRIVNRTGAPRVIRITASWGAVDGYLFVYTDPFVDSDVGCLAGNDDFNGTAQSRIAEQVIGEGEVLAIVSTPFGTGGVIDPYSVVVETLPIDVPPEGACDDGIDNDRDGYVDCEDFDCNDPVVCAGQQEFDCEDGLDDDGNGFVDCLDFACRDDPACAAGGALVPGVQQRVALAAVQARGWRVCHTSTFDASGQPVAGILGACDGPQLMLACRLTDGPTLQLAAEGERGDVTFDVGGGAAVSHAANGVQWYFSPNRSWGFAPGGAAVNLNSCDFGGEQPERRMCVHITPAGLLNSGYRCGDNDLNDNANYERLVLTR